MTRIGIYGYGNLGRGVEAAINQNDDMELVAVFTRRNPDELVIKNQTAKVCNVKDMADWKDKIDVMILCGGSATDLPEQTPECAKYFNVIDSFDTHARIPEHFANVDASAKASGHIGIISLAGIRACSHSTVCTEMHCFRREMIIHSGARVSVRDIPMPSVVSQVSRMPSSIRFP